MGGTRQDLYDDHAKAMAYGGQPTALIEAKNCRTASILPGPFRRTFQLTNSGFRSIKDQKTPTPNTDRQLTCLFRDEAKWNGLTENSPLSPADCNGIYTGT